MKRRRRTVPPLPPPARPDNGAVPVHRYESAAAVAAAALAIRHVKARGPDPYGTHYGGWLWCGCADDEEALSIAQRGDPSQREAVLAAVDKWDARAHRTERSLWVPAVAGAFPCVPAFLAGDPESMRVRTTEASDSAPVRLFCWSMANASTGTDAMVARAADIAGLALALSRVRPVEVWGIWGTERADVPASASWIVWRVAVDVLDASSVAGAMHPAVARGWCAALGARLPGGQTAHWPWAIYPRAEHWPEIERRIRVALAMDAADVLVRPLFSPDGNAASAELDAILRSKGGTATD